MACKSWVSASWRCEKNTKRWTWRKFYSKSATKKNKQRSSLFWTKSITKRGNSRKKWNSFGRKSERNSRSPSIWRWKKRKVSPRRGLKSIFTNLRKSNKEGKLKNKNQQLKSNRFWVCTQRSTIKRKRRRNFISEKCKKIRKRRLNKCKNKSSSWRNGSKSTSLLITRSLKNMLKGMISYWNTWNL